MTKCKLCSDDFEYKWLKVDDRWKLVNPNTGTPHICKNNKPREISSVEPKPNVPKETHSALWKKDWKPEMDLPVKRFCGVCKTVLMIVSDCPYCEKFRMNPCQNWCVKCKNHPDIINVGESG